MNKTAIKNFAIWARRELISRVSQKAAQYGILENNSIPATADAVNGKVLSEAEKKQRMSLIARIHRAGYSQTMEEIAYTWFNRFCALRFMEVNGYLPSLVRVFSDENGDFKPQILASAIDLDLDGLDHEKVFAFKDANQTEELYQYLLITQCNALSSILPGMFQIIEDETELLCPDNLLREGSVIAHMVHDIPEEDWKDAVQIIGWLYQFYNTEPKDQVFANLKKNIKISKENIPAATQLFTPDWIVRYMVENSLGRLYIQSKIGKWTGSEAERQKQEKSIADRLGWKYYLVEAEQVPDVRAKLNSQIAECNPEKLKVIDPCMGSGHILAYMFDVLMQIYQDCGYDNRDAVASIILNNLFGLDIDERATQLSYFAVMMKARQYDRGFFRRQLQPKVYAICESNDISLRYLEYYYQNDNKLRKEIKSLIEVLHDAKEYGSILKISSYDFAAMNVRLEELKQESVLDAIGAVKELHPLIECAKVLSQKYDIVITNPPYMGSGGMSEKLNDFVKENYPKTKSDMSTVFMERTLSMCKDCGYMAMINIPVWMFLSSYQQLRESIIGTNTFVNMIHCGRGIFGSDFGTTSFVISKFHTSSYKGLYRRLFNKNVEVDSVETKERWFFEGKGLFRFEQEDFFKIPGFPIAYWASEAFRNAFLTGSLLGTLIPVKKGMDTGNNSIFLRHWQEIDYKGIDFNATRKKWIPYDKGGDFRRWYGNNEYVLFWNGNGDELRKSSANLRSEHLYFLPSITWNALSSGNTCFRFSLFKGAFDSAGSSMFPEEQDIPVYLGLMNSRIVQHYMNVINPTLNYGAGSVALIPVLNIGNYKDLISDRSAQSINIGRTDWDSFETSWDFQGNPLIEANDHSKCAGMLFAAYGQLRLIWEQQCEAMRKLEVENNRVFIEIYGLQDELSPEVPWNEITLTCNPWYRYGKTPELEPDGQHFSRTSELKVGTIFAMDPPYNIRVSSPNPIMKVSSFPFNQELENRLLQDTIKELLSYAVGCMFGRYSLDVPGLVYAGGKWDPSKYSTFHADDDNIIPICDDEYFKDDLSSRFASFIETVFGAESLEENLNFIAKALGGRGSSREVIRKYFREEFFADHCKMYQKHPIYWLFDSGKKGGFRALIYMHRYQPDTLARLRTDYVHEQQERYRTAMADLTLRMDKASASEKIKLEKQLRAFREQAEETRLYEEKIHHLADKMISIDLDDGVKHNYAIFQDVLAKIK